MMEEFLWVEKYRPKTVSETILPDDLKRTFEQFVKQGNIPNLILAGSAGVGKTTVARAMLEELDCDYIVINGSLEGRSIDVLRNEIHTFASSVSLSGGRKYVILDEADYLNPQTIQPALRNFMEEFSANCGFILTCNFVDRIIDPLHSRCSVIKFRIRKSELAELAKQFMRRVLNILDTENVQYEKPVVAEVIKQHFPDWRRVINELQRYSAIGKIDSGILSTFTDTNMRNLVQLLKDKNFTGMRRWVGESEYDVNEFYREFYDQSERYLSKASVPQLVLLIAKYQYQGSFVVNQEINLAAFLTEVMAECEFI